MKKSIIVNTSRGPSLRKDLVDALNNNVISSGTLDVYDQEPLPKDHILRKTNILLYLYWLRLSEAYEKFFNGYLLAIEAFLNKAPVNQIS